jgi:hypothetical protein
MEIQNVFFLVFGAIDQSFYFSGNVVIFFIVIVIVISMITFRVKV